MPLLLWLGTLLGSLFGSLFSFFMQYATKRIAIIVTVVAAISALTIAFFAAVLSLLNALVISAPFEVNLAISWVLPSNATSCLGLVFTAHTLRWVYEWNVKVIQFRLF